VEGSGSKREVVEGTRLEVVSSERTESLGRCADTEDRPILGRSHDDDEGCRDEWSGSSWGSGSRTARETRSADERRLGEPFGKPGVTGRLRGFGGGGSCEARRLGSSRGASARKRGRGDRSTLESCLEGRLTLQHSPVFPVIGGSPLDRAPEARRSPRDVRNGRGKALRV
jgi:hypothetical protein